MNMLFLFQLMCGSARFVCFTVVSCILFQDTVLSLAPSPFQPHHLFLGSFARLPFQHQLYDGKPDAVGMRRRSLYSSLRASQVKQFQVIAIY